MTNLDELVDKFIAKMFPNRVGSGIAKIVEEVAEFSIDPSVEEAADVLICLLVELRQRGHSVNELMIATRAKMIMNLSRRWELQADGTIHHY